MDWNSSSAGKGPLLVALSMVLLVSSLLISESALAVPANPAVETLTQPDGTVTWVIHFGDEWLNGLRTRDGYTILLDEVTGFWVYAEPAIAGGLQK